MGFLIGKFSKKKSAGSDADAAQDSASSQSAKKVSTRKPIKPSAPAPAAAPSNDPGTERRTQKSRRVVAAKPGGTRSASQAAETASASDDDLDLIAPVAAPAPKQSNRDHIADSTKPQFSGSVASSRPKGPARSGDAALLEFLKTKASLINDAQADDLTARAERDNLALDAAGVALGLFSEDQLVNALTQECWVPHLKVDKYEIRKKALDTLTREDAEHFGAFPVDKLGSLLTLAMVNPLDAETIRALEAKTGLDIKKVVATRGEIAQAIDKYYGGKVQAKDTSLSFSQDVEPKSLTQLMGSIDTTPAGGSLLADVNSEIQDIDDLLSADDAIAPAILEPVRSEAELLVVPAGEVIEILDEPGVSALEARPASQGSDLFLDDNSQNSSDLLLDDPLPASAAANELVFGEPTAKPVSKPHKPAVAAQFDLDDTGPVTSEPLIAPATSRSIPKPPPAAAKPGTLKPAGSATRPTATKIQIINLIPVMEDEFQHAITHGKSHVFEKWIGLQSRNRIINAQAVESELDDILAELYASPRK